MVHHPLDPHHPLRATEAAEGRGALGIGAQSVRRDAHGGQPIGVVGVQHRAVGHGQGQVLRPAAAGVLGEDDAGDPPRVVEARVIVDAEIVALAGDDHVVVAVVAHLDGAARAGGHQRAGNGERVALAFLAAEAAAHAPRFHPHGMHGHPQRMGDLVLDFRRVLGGGADDHVAAFLRQGGGGLSFEIEMLLRAQFQGAACAVRGGGDGGVRIAPAIDAGSVLEPCACREGVVDGQDRGRGVGRDLRAARGGAGGDVAVGGDEEQGLPRVVDRPVAEERFVMGRRRAVGIAPEVRRTPCAHDARRGAHQREVQRHKPPGGDGAEPESEVQRAGGQRDVIDVARLPGDVQTGRVVGQRATHGGGDGARAGGRGIGGHGATSSTSVAVPSSAWTARHSRFCATVSL